MMPKLSVILLVSLAASPAAAQQKGEEARACVPIGERFIDYDRERTEDWAQEVARLRKNAGDVTRQDDKLTLALDDGRSVDLQDCPFGDAGYQYLYERYDAPGRFYVVRTPAYDDLYYTLVMKRTGRLMKLFGTPVWASDKSRFLTVACSLQPQRAALTIYSVRDDALVADAEFPLPCERESCSARWDFQSWISIACTPRDDAGKRGTEFTLLRASDGTWKNMGR